MSEEANQVAIRALAATRHVPDSHLKKWLAMDTASRIALREIAERLKLRTGQIVSAIDFLEEISVREGAHPAAILARDEVHRACARNGSAPARAAAFLDALRAIRFPRLRRAMDRIAAEAAALKLPPGIRVVLPKDLHSDELAIQISARTGREVAALIDALGEKKSGLVRLAKLLGGGDDGPIMINDDDEV